MDKSNRELRNQIVFLVIYLAIYFAAMILISQPWRVKLFLRKAQMEVDQLRGIHPLSGAQEMLVREFRDRVSEWDHAESTARKDSKGDH
jgi:hypothetical protein